MPRQANGTYLAPANTAAVTSTPISSTAFNTLETDIGNEITNSLDRGGRSAMTAALPMGGQKITGMADPTVVTDGATKNYVDTTTAAFFSTGDGKITLKTVADSGWLLCDDGTFGSATSGSSNSNNINNLALFNLFFNNISDTAAPILTSGGGATTRAAQTNAATAWAANCRMTLTKQLGRAIVGAGAGAGLSARALGSNFGIENINLSLAQLPAGITSTGTFPLSLSVGLVTAPVGFSTYSANPGSQVWSATSAGNFVGNNGATASGTVTSNNTGGALTSMVQPSAAWNVMVKL